VGEKALVCIGNIAAVALVVATVGILLHGIKNMEKALVCIGNIAAVALVVATVGILLHGIKNIIIPIIKTECTYVIQGMEFEIKGLVI
jgi:hypothetical protein